MQLVCGTLIMLCETHCCHWSTVWFVQYCVICTGLCDLYRAVNSRPLCLKTVPSKGLMGTNSSNHNSGSARAGLHSGTRKRLRKHMLTKQWGRKVWHVHRLLPSFDNTARVGRSLWVRLYSQCNKIPILVLFTCRYCTSRCLCYITVKSTAWNKVLYLVFTTAWQRICSCLCKSMSCGHYKHAYVYQYLVFMPMYINIVPCLCITSHYHCCSFLLPKSAARSHTEAYWYWRSSKQYWVGDNNDCYFTHYSANKRDLFHYSLAWNHHVSRWMFKQSPVTCWHTAVTTSEILHTQNITVCQLKGALTSLTY